MAKRVCRLSPPYDANRIYSFPVPMMASTSVHLPAPIVEQLDRLAAQWGISRNRVILQACEELLAEKRGEWPADFFNRTLPPSDLDELRAAGREMEAAILAARHTRQVPPL